MEEVRPNVLVIDGIAADRQKVRENLQSQFTVLEGESRADARELLSAHPIELLILAEELADHSGLALLSTLRHDPKYLSLPIIVLSASDEEVGIEAAFEAGASDFIRKPLSSFELKARVALAMRGKEASQQVEGLIDELKKRSERDALTDVYNRFGFQRHAIKELAKAKRSCTLLSFLMMDIDHFKWINDEHGHLIGDEILLGFTQVLAENLRNYDLIARFGGDEFVVVLPHTGERQAMLVAEKILRRLKEEPQNTKKGKVSLTTSIGVITFHPQAGSSTGSDSEDLDALLAQADQMLYRAKQMGRNRAVAAQPEVGGVG